MATLLSPIEQEHLDLRKQVGQWKSLHARAVEREAKWKEKAEYWERIAKRLGREVQEKDEIIEALKAKIVLLNQQIFGRKTERSEDLAQAQAPVESTVPAPPPPDRVPSGRKRGKQPGAKGHGRKLHPELPQVDLLHDLPPDKKLCPNCGESYEPFGTEDSFEFHWEVKVIRRRHRRARYRKGCRCPGVPGIITAPAPPKLFPRGMFSIEFWVRVLLAKFDFQLPLHRVRRMIAAEGLVVSLGTLTEGFKRLVDLIEPLYLAILMRSRRDCHWHLDETTWRVYAKIEEKEGYRWWLWVIVGSDTCCYLLEPTRSGKVPADHLGEAEGIASVDRYKAYRRLCERIALSFCWAHVRRDFVRLWQAHESFRSWTKTWLLRIKNLYKLNKERLAVQSDPELFGKIDHKLRVALDWMVQQRDRCLALPDLHAAQRKVLESLREHWDGLMIFVDHPEIPMDNNEAERRLRNPVVGRKNYWGSGSIWSAHLTAMLFTVFETLKLNRIDQQRFLIAYFEACARNGGRPPESVESFLPWNLSEQDRAAWQSRAPPS